MLKDAGEFWGVLQAIEQRCNSVIREAHAVRQILVDDSNRKGLSASRLLRGNLPSPDRVKGAVRLIEIEGVDVNACGGTHLLSTAELQVYTSIWWFQSQLNCFSKKGELHQIIQLMEIHP